MTPKVTIKVIGDGWTFRHGQGPRKIPDKLHHLEYSNADGSSRIRAGKKRTHPFPPIVSGQQD